MTEGKKEEVWYEDLDGFKKCQKHEAFITSIGPACPDCHEEDHEKARKWDGLGSVQNLEKELSSLRSLAGRMAFCIEALYSGATPETCDDSLAMDVKDTLEEFKRLTNG